MQAAIRLLYAFAVAIFLVLTVAFGLLTFYPSPEAPRYPSPRPTEAAVTAPSTAAPATPGAVVEKPETPAEVAEFDRQYQEYEEKREVHHRNVLLIATGLAALAIIVGIVAAGALDVLRVGLMLGGLLTVLWGLAYGAGDVGPGLIFVAAMVALFLLVALSQERARSWLGRTFRMGDGDDLLAK